MAWLKQNPLFAALLCASAAACLGQGWLIHSARDRVHRADAQLAAARQERDRLARQSPALSEENARAIAADVATAERRIAELRAGLAARIGLPNAPARSLDGYFALASFAEKMRALAGRQQVALRADEHFGFSAYAHAGPEPDLLAPVHRQCVVMQHLLEALFEAQPDALVAAQREPPLTAAQRAARAGPEAPAEAARLAEPGADFFAPDEQLRLRVSGLVDGELYRVVFTGQTQVLRVFLNAVATSPLPLFVRAVEVEPEAPEAGAPAEGQGVSVPDAPAGTPLVGRGASKFSVVVECAEVLSVPSAPST